MRNKNLSPKIEKIKMTLTERERVLIIEIQFKTNLRKALIKTTTVLQESILDSMEEVLEVA